MESCEEVISLFGKVLFTFWLNSMKHSPLGGVGSTFLPNLECGENRDALVIGRSQAWAAKCIGLLLIDAILYLPPIYSSRDPSNNVPTLILQL